MFLSPPRKKNNLTTYSKKAQRTYRSTLPSPTSDDRQLRRRRVTLTSPIHSEHPPASLGSVSLSSSAQSDNEDIEVQPVDTEIAQSNSQRRSNLPAEPLLNHELQLAASPERIASPVSSSEHDSISDDDLILADRDGQQHTSRILKRQPLSKLRKALNTRPKKLQSAMKRPTSVLSSETLREIERGADGFDEMHLILLATSKPRSMKRKAKSTTSALDLLKGPHPPVDFDDPDWSKVPYQDSLAQQQETFLDTTETTRDEPQVIPENPPPKAQGFKSPLVSPTRPSKKEVLLYAQLSSVSAPIMRRPSYDEESEESYANGFMEEAEEEEGEVSEHRTSDAEQEEQRASTVR
ncbi:hypothetical protein KCU65_g1250, partial [Aureobasidium melanogenum]